MGNNQGRQEHDEIIGAERGRIHQTQKMGQGKRKGIFLQ